MNGFQSFWLAISAWQCGLPILLPLVLLGQVNNPYYYLVRPTTLTITWSGQQTAIYWMLQIPVICEGNTPFILAISLASVSLSFSHQFFVGQNTSTEHPTDIVSKQSASMCSWSPFASTIGTKSRTFFMLWS